MGPQLEKASGIQVWPISAGSWAMQNEMEYLSEHPDVPEGVDRIEASFQFWGLWGAVLLVSEQTHPREYPAYATWYLIQKYLFAPVPKTPPALLVAPEDPWKDFEAFIAGYGGMIDIWVYPDKAENSDADRREARLGSPMARLLALQSTRLKVHLVQEIDGWNGAIYQDEIHPTPAGTAILAKAIAAAL